MATEGIAFDLRGLIENSLLEWEDRLAAVAVAGGCNLRCPFCHSWRYVTGLSGLAPRNPDDIISLLERQRGWIDGVVFTGGEPTLQPGLAESIRRVRGYGVRVKLHTNGTRPGTVAELLRDGLLDCLALDYKAPLDDRFLTATGTSGDAGRKLLELVRESFALAASAMVEREYHTTLAPFLIDESAFREMVDCLRPGGLWILQQFENDDCLSPDLSAAPRHSPERLDELAALAGVWRGRVILRKGKSG